MTDAKLAEIETVKDFIRKSRTGEWNGWKGIDGGRHLPSRDKWDAETEAMCERLSHLAVAQEQQAAQAAELLSLARAYDPNCDEYHYETQLAAMKAARQTVEAMQELATFLGGDPEGHLASVPDKAKGRMEAQDAEVERVQEELAKQKRELDAAVQHHSHHVKKIDLVLGEPRQDGCDILTCHLNTIAKLKDSLAAERVRAERAEGELAKMRECCEQGQGRANNFLAGLKTGPVFVMVHALRQDFDEALGKDFSVDPTPTPAATEGE